MKRPIIAISMGDPAGIGPEITVKALDKKEIYEICRPLVVGNREVLKQAMDFSGVQLEIRKVEHPDEGDYQYGTIDLVHMDNVKTDELKLGEIQPMAGKAAYDYFMKAGRWAHEGIVDAVATTPINKESLQAAKVPFIDHTAMLAHISGVKDPLTMFEVHDLRIFFLTRHLSLKEAIGIITVERVHDYLKRCDEALKKLGLSRRKLAVAALNPHAGEQGLFGNEEMEILAPGIEKARGEGLDVVGPVPADSVFHQALHGKYDAVLSLYHDQGHIAAKMADFERTVSITNGLPFLRTSVDHGTALDIAGKGIASSVSMEECIKAAAKYAPHFTQIS
ncbi:4-hydroxythreonine-4-phosphate dehydrogenase [Melghirimyces profundicolus]|uniref:4-hydroxythreonine-4-phosphate dehydrogenase n=1 Tax=Melghirimyces profundicolus TaxID=1242148 RepID=A0A2T6C8P0_9BACL|nr:4-hydroxythreonine-4-phosphate dehydrogenase PdxA [Melghirimyces profundicolus]PTX64680.1 4-hydroxythreonine-4-phosphate dehydrogenase [Melghirimyces profundicolus]